RGGDANGGGISIENRPLSGQTDVDLFELYVNGNMVIAGDGGFAGRGGGGAEFGGTGGNGGDGGFARGGGIHLDRALATLERSTVERNIGSSGFGAQGGYGGAAGEWRGGDAGHGGQAGMAMGGGIDNVDTVLTATRSTIAFNHVASGFG